MKRFNSPGISSPHYFTSSKRENSTRPRRPDFTWHLQSFLNQLVSLHSLMSMQPFHLVSIERLTFTGAAVPGYVKEYIEGNEAFLDLRSRRNTCRINEESSVRQPFDTPTETGVINGGGTCYQNVVWRLFLSSERCMALAAEPTAGRFFSSVNQEDDLGFHVFDLILKIAAGDFEASKERLKEFWTILQEQPVDHREIPWTPGRQQDPVELLTRWFAKSLRSNLLSPAFGHVFKASVSCPVLSAFHSEANSFLRTFA